MKIGFIVSSFGNFFRGGAEIQIENTMNALNKISGIEINIVSKSETSLEKYDIIHFFQSNAEYCKILPYLKNKKIPFVISTIYFPNFSIILNIILYKIRGI